MLDRITADEPTLRAFATVVNGRSGTMWIDPRIYPWSLIERQPAVAEARDAARRGVHARARNGGAPSSKDCRSRYSSDFRRARSMFAPETTIRRPGVR